MAAWCCLVLGAELQPEVASEIDFFLNICPLHTRKCQFNRPIKHTMPESDEQVQREVEERTGTRPCIWQIKVVRKVLEGGDIITIAATGSGKSLTYLGFSLPSG